MWQRIIRASSILLTVTVLGMAFAAPASADTERGHTGLVGVHRLRDVYGYPGVRCYFEGPKAAETLVAIDVRSPVVFARDATSDVDIQRVGWRATVQRLSGGSWISYLNGPVERDYATDRHPGEFTRWSVDLPNGTYRVFVKMYWYDPLGRTVVGTATHRNDFYAIILNGDQAFQADGHC
jgi:hypothetical protein